ncbi:TonB family protein [Rhizomicrobium palustre]|jgi:protein TonB|uniref:TonB family protein n=1 Tax=Rhizomicrobium palustre TaxID=189966 RepID=A0A846N046_9PROT|nr:energy transducer TonB [Rhizomicrobium palustre]NIK88570.1 TonB family protein [Rhizomicrobium palustre]
MPAKANKGSLRVSGIVLASLLQAGFVWALISGLQIRASDVIRDPVNAFFPKDSAKPPQTPPPAASEQLPVEVFVPKPVFEIAEPPGETVITPLPNRPMPPQGVERGPVALMATHTIPPYPALEARLGAEGTVVLRITIGTDGAVKAAQVVRSSGYEGLDRAAVAWVLAHWRYQPALRSGTPVDSAANVAVRFNLKSNG